jgi:cytochrome P450
MDVLIDMDGWIIAPDILWIPFRLTCSRLQTIMEPLSAYLKTVIEDRRKEGATPKKDIIDRLLQVDPSDSETLLLSDTENRA